MKKWIVLAVAMMMVTGVQAKEKAGAKETTKEQFIATAQKRAEAAGTAFDKAKAEAAFTAKDKNGDGVLSGDELAPADKQGKKGKKGKKSAE